MELDGCKICSLFGGPHAEHAGWNGAHVTRDSAVVPRLESTRARRRVEQAYREATESDDRVDDFVDSMSQPVTGEVLPKPWDPTGTNDELSFPASWKAREPRVETWEPYLRGEKSLEDYRTGVTHYDHLHEEPIVAPGWVYAPQAESGRVPAEPTVDEVDALITDALKFAYVGQTVRLTVKDAGTGETATFSLIKRDEGDVEAERVDRIRELEAKIRHDLQEGDR